MAINRKLEHYMLYYLSRSVLSSRSKIVKIFNKLNGVYMTNQHSDPVNWKFRISLVAVACCSVIAAVTLPFI